MNAISSGRGGRGLLPMSGVEDSVWQVWGGVWVIAGAVTAIARRPGVGRAGRPVGPPRGVPVALAHLGPPGCSPGSRLAARRPVPVGARVSIPASPDEGIGPANWHLRGGSRRRVVGRV